MFISVLIRMEHRPSPNAHRGIRVQAPLVTPLSLLLYIFFSEIHEILDVPFCSICQLMSSLCGNLEDLHMVR